MQILADIETYQAVQQLPGTIHMYQHFKKKNCLMLIEIASEAM